MTRISLKAHAALGREARKQNVTAGVVEATLLPGDVAAWLASPRLQAALDAYLGAKAYVRTRIAALRLTNLLRAPYSGAEPNLLGYPSGFWHHDRCGRLCGNQIYGAFVPARRRGEVGSSPLDGASTGTRHTG